MISLMKESDVHSHSEAGFLSATIRTAFAAPLTTATVAASVSSTSVSSTTFSTAAFTSTVASPSLSTSTLHQRTRTPTLNRA